MMTSFKHKLMHIFHVFNFNVQSILFISLLFPNILKHKILINKNQAL